MRIAEIQIKHFRSILDLQLTLSDLNILCGANSCGKSNILRAILFAFKPEISNAEIYDNLIAEKRDAQGGPKLSIYVTCKLINCPTSIQAIVGNPGTSTLIYSFRAYRSGKIERKLNQTTMSNEHFKLLREQLEIVYIPTIRDLSTGGLEPFLKLYRDILIRARGTNITKYETELRKHLREKGKHILSVHENIAKMIPKGKQFDINTSNVRLEDIYKSIGITLLDNQDKRFEIGTLGTGHQSMLIMNMYRQLGQTASGKTIFLFEEPDNHLHPATIKTISEDLKNISNSSQVLVTTHSSVLINSVGITKTQSFFNDAGVTRKREINLSGYTDENLKALFLQYGVRASDPLFANRVIIVEGPFDATILSKLLELKSGYSPDQLGILMLVAGGKDGVVKICRLLEAFQVDWRAVLDWDASFNSNVPMTRDSISTADKASGTSAANTLLGLCDSSSKRGRKTAKTIQAMADELGSTRITPTVYDNSPVAELNGIMKNRLSSAKISSLKDSLTRRRKTVYRPLLEQINCALLSDTIEGCILRTSEIVDFAGSFLLGKNEIKSLETDPIKKRRQVQNALKKCAFKNEILRELVDNLESKKLFSRSDINYVYGFIFKGIQE